MNLSVLKATMESSIDLEHWMTNLPAQLKAWPLIHLAIPGSHDSMTSTITKSSKLAPDAECLLRRLKFLGPLLRLIISRWSKTQSLDTTDQLKSGIRYFDLRVATKKGNVFPYFVHGLYAKEVVTMFADIRDFIDTHQNEVVILDFQHFYEFTNDDHQNLMQLLNTTFKYRMLPHTRDMRHISLDHMTRANKYQIILVYRFVYTQQEQPYLWPSYSFPTPWPQTISESELIQKLDRGIATRLLTVGYVSQCVLTPTNSFVTKHLFSTLKKQCVLPLEPAKLEWIRRQKIGERGVNIIISDFIDINDNQFSMEVVALNIKMITANSSILTPVE